MNSLEKNYRGLLGWMMQAQGSGLRTLIAAGAWFHLRNYLLNSFHATVLFLYPLKNQKLLTRYSSFNMTWMCFA